MFKQFRNLSLMSLGDVKWLAGKGDRDAQLKLSGSTEISADEQAFWFYKSNGGKAFSIEAWKLEIEECKKQWIAKNPDCEVVFF